MEFARALTRAGSPPRLDALLRDPHRLQCIERGIYGFPIENATPGLIANRHYFSNPTWAKGYLEACHRDAEFRDRWSHVTGRLDGKVVVDVGCGPGNVYAALGGKPALLIGVDVAPGSLGLARDLGYTPLYADAHDLPLVSECADLVVANATLHHCENMWVVLREAARLVKPGGLLVTDHDPQRDAYRFRGLGLLLWKARVPIYSRLGRGAYGDPEERKSMLATEIHHEIGDGLEEESFHEVLRPLGFEVQVYRHNNKSGSELFRGVRAAAARRVQLTQTLSGINSHSDRGALTLMCVARRL